ncbi:peptidylprolyl isomerase [Candidatus Berkelbacteria bacterium]|nr:peptidylprolyl isomerase [Candidatus Berkelbacteria bacterium]
MNTFIVLIQSLLDRIRQMAQQIRLKQFFADPFLFLIPLAILYFILMVGFGLSWYKFNSQKPIVKRSLHYFPFPAAYVNGGVVWSSQLDDQVGFVTQFSEKTGQSQVAVNQAPAKIFDRLIENKLIEREAAKNGLKVTAREVNEAYKKITDQHGGEQDVTKLLLNLYGMTPADFKKLVASELIKQKIKDELLVNVKVRHILVKDEKRAKDILDKLKSGGKFEDLAKEFSEDTNSREKGGDLGFIRRGQLNDKFENAAFGTKPGELYGDPVKTDQGFEIIKVDERKGKVDKTYEKWLEDLKASTRVVRFVKI